jgi:hypothetical protein
MRPYSKGVSPPPRRQVCSPRAGPIGYTKIIFAAIVYLRAIVCIFARVLIINDNID